jgi:uncharacterized protein YjeT (DUF2065 family)
MVRRRIEMNIKEKREMEKMVDEVKRLRDREERMTVGFVVVSMGVVALNIGDWVSRVFGMVLVGVGLMIGVWGWWRR